MYTLPEENNWRKWTSCFVDDPAGYCTVSCSSTGTRIISGLYPKRKNNAFEQKTIPTKLGHNPEINVGNNPPLLNSSGPDNRRIAF